MVLDEIWRQTASAARPRLHAMKTKNPERSRKRAPRTVPRPCRTAQTSQSIHFNFFNPNYLYILCSHLKYVPRKLSQKPWRPARLGKCDLRQPSIPSRSFFRNVSPNTIDGSVFSNFRRQQHAADCNARNSSHDIGGSSARRQLSGFGSAREPPPIGWGRGFISNSNSILAGIPRAQEPKANGLSRSDCAPKLRRPFGAVGWAPSPTANGR